MTIRIYELNGHKPCDVWEDYPFVPNVGDNVSTPTSGLKTVKYRVFKKDAIEIRIAEL